MAHKFKSGDKVRVISTVDARGHTCGDWLEKMGKVFTVDITNDGGGHYVVHLKEGSRFEERMLELATPITKGEKLIAAKEAELARLKDAAAKRAKDAAERKAKAERANILAGLSAAGKRVVAMLQAGAASDFGCQRANVILLAAAITGDSADKITKAIAK